ncbi:MAG: hypothetical protein HXX08_25110 [Chloroflexi bacterium]|uniref:Uncharacterized protein n=1 Tax=Candidatus Chlorohelix allophototropha TaxID=3003348 RepID=A0A8T7MAG4_9CHLR|nr:hypothetical protein [Chloroflexota bacterium]WJW70336.1 hypothetical protein OZ401_005070 [Chloroflexota bacterium L227-S17]
MEDEPKKAEQTNDEEKPQVFAVSKKRGGFKFNRRDFLAAAVTVGITGSLVNGESKEAVAKEPNSYSLFLPLLDASSFSNDKFQQKWEYSDRLVILDPTAGRGYTWGPNSFGTYQENYVESNGGKRQVQYFDKSRMELANDGVTVTNGLLTKELVTGLQQDGNSLFIQKTPCQVQVAGDDNSGTGNKVAPSYASFRSVITFNPGINIAPSLIGQPANLAINKAGEVSTLDNPPARVLISSYEATLGHNVPDTFQNFQNLVGRIWDGSKFVQGKIFTDNPIANVFGYPVTEPYWIRAVVAGAEKDVLAQLFERRVLTYTPSNPDPYKVEMGNIGQHYHFWRYGNNSNTAIKVQPTQMTSYKISGKEFTQPCGAPIPAGAVCVCNCVAGTSSCNPNCTCNLICTCDAQCTCQSYCSINYHYWHPN